MPAHIAILGGGLSGLAHGWFLKQLFGSQIRLSIFEKAIRPGGWIETCEVDGFLFEQGPRSFRTRGKGEETLALIEGLGLQKEVLVPDPEASRRYIYYGERLTPLPRHWWQIPFSPLTRGWLKALWRDRSMPKAKEEESIQAFFERRLGGEWVERLIDPFISGIYAGDCQKLSLKSCFPLLDEWEQQRGSLLRGAWKHRPRAHFQSPFIQEMRSFPLLSFKKGMESLPKMLSFHLREHLFCHQGVAHLTFKQKGIDILLENGENIKADWVISTLPSFALSTLLGRDPELSTFLQQLRYATVVQVNIGFHSSVLPLKGFGYLVPSRDALPILGCIWDSSLFPQQNQRELQTRLTVMLGGIRYPQIGEWPEQVVIDWALRALRQHLKIFCQPDVIQVKRAIRAIPQYELGYDQWKQTLQQRLLTLSPAFILSGSGFTGVSMNDSVETARKNAEYLFYLLKKDNYI